MKKIILLLLFVGISPCFVWGQTMVLPDNPLIQYSGRIDFSNPREPRFDWPGVSLTVKFQGYSIGFLLEDGNNNFEVQVDGQPATVWVTQPDQDLYSLSDLSSGEHLVRIVKRTEAIFGTTLFKGLMLNKSSSLLESPPKPTRKIEFVGDSIVCGYGDEATTLKCDSLRPYENVDKAFGADAARDLNAEAVFVAYSGKGVVRNWGDKKRKSSDPFPPLYNRTLCHDPKNLWDFSQWIPDAVIVHLGSNDFSSEPHADPQDYIKNYIQLLKAIRKNYPEASLYCMCTMGWPNFHQWVEEVVKNRNDSGDKNVYFVGYPNVPENELGCDYHPNVKAHRQIADVLVPILRKTLGW
jgi:hypothetical protein